jgi:outer membrane immunogenic protein
MKKTLMAGALITGAMLGALGSVMAADMKAPAPMLMKAPMAPVLSWTGCYISGGVGYGMWSQEHFEETGPPISAGFVQLESSSDSSGRGWLGRVGAGCDYQIASSFVIGAFGDYDFTSLKGTVVDPDVVGVPFQFNEKQSSAWAVGGRVGYLPYPDLMTFVEGGYTQAHFGAAVETTTNLAQTPFAQFVQSQTYHGWFIGSGTEYRIPWAGFNGLFWRSEYRYSTFEAADVPLINTPAGVPSGFYEHSKKFVQTVTSSLVWKFNWGH